MALFSSSKGKSLTPRPEASSFTDQHVGDIIGRYGSFHEAVFQRARRLLRSLHRLQNCLKDHLRVPKRPFVEMPMHSGY